MNPAAPEPPNRTSRHRIKSVTIMGRSHHFLWYVRKYQNSATREGRFCRASSSNFAVLSSWGFIGFAPSTSGLVEIPFDALARPVRHPVACGEAIRALLLLLGCRGGTPSPRATERA